MTLLMRILGALGILAGLFVTTSIRSDIQIIIVLIFWGFAIVFFALGSLCEDIERISRGVRKVVKVIDDSDNRNG